LRRLFARLGYARAGSVIWTEDDFGFEEDDDLVLALAHAFARQALRALAGGPLRGYVTREDALPLVRGRWRIGDQLTRRGGQPLPVEVSFDDYVEDIVENQVLLSAATRLLRLPGVPADVLGALRRILRVLDGVSVILIGAPVPVVRAERRNARYSSALALASLVLWGRRLSSASAQLSRRGSWSTCGRCSRTSCRLPCVRLSSRTGASSSLSARRRSTWGGGAVKIAPDLVWLVDGEVRACIDVKYKVEKYGQYPNADLYQMAAYCRRFGLGEGHLVYAAGESEERQIEVIDGPLINQHALDLSRSMAAVVHQLSSFV
jgi:5-methylcytosine-specific restriction enzyme subunit McrC